MMVALAVLLFPKLALGLSGFETGVAVMPLVEGQGDDDGDAPAVADRATRASCCGTAALIMSVLLIGSSIVTATLIPPDALAAGGAANGRALAFLAHRDLGDGVRHASTTCRRSRSSGSPARRRWPAC